MEQTEDRLKTLLISQNFPNTETVDSVLENAKSLSRCFVEVTDGIAVLSDFKKHVCYTFSGKFGMMVFNMPVYSMDGQSPFEDNIFNNISKEDLLERHILELRFFHFIMTVPVKERRDYQMSCIVRMSNSDGSMMPVLHNSRYIRSLENGAVWLALCTYQPLPILDIGTHSGVFNTSTGKPVNTQDYTSGDSKLLSKRQTEILSLLAKGEASKQIADRLNISVHTVNRHRQDILAALKVSNTASAVEIALRLRLI